MDASRRIDQQIAELADWRGLMLAKLRRIIHHADPEIVEEWKWMGTPTWSHEGLVACANPHTGKVKLTFQQGARLPDPAKLFNASLDGNQRRAIDIFEADHPNEAALKDLVRAAVAYNHAQGSSRARAKGARQGHRPAPRARKASPRKGR